MRFNKKLLLIVSPFLLTSCVSVRLTEQKQIQKSEKVRFVAPESPFIPLENGQLDRGWRNSVNGNSISYLSECSLNIDPSLENIQRGIIKGVQNADVLKSETFHYNRREALRTVIVGEVDGISSKVDFVILKKNGCNYILTYVALLNNFEQNLADFENFIREFKAP